MSHETMLATRLQEFVAAWNARDVRRLLTFFHPNGSFHGPVGPDPLGVSAHGHEAIRDALAAIFKLLPDGTLVPILLFFSGNRALSEWYYEFSGADGKPTRTYGCDVYEFAGYLIQSKNAYIKQYAPRI